LVGQTTSVIYDDLVDLFHSVDVAHRMSPGCKWMLADSSIKVIKKIKDSTGRPLWQPGVSAGAGAGFPDTILDKPYVLNNDIAVMAANAKSILFGDLSKYKIRQVMGFTLLRLVERYAEFGQVGFLAFMRADGNLIDAGSNPVKYYQNSAT
jgi:HK97 family phage major capsid protein